MDIRLLTKFLVLAFLSLCTTSATGTSSSPSIIPSTTSSLPSTTISKELTTIVIIGPTGSGKSSLANVLLGESPLCQNCTFPVCSQGMHSCTKETSMTRGPWLGENDLVQVVDTPGFGDSDNDDSELVDEMMTVLNKDVGSANLILLLIKGTETRLGGELQQMIREMRALFGEQMWNNLVIGVSFWSFKSDVVDYRRNTCKWSPGNCRDEEWFSKSMLNILQEKFTMKYDLPFVFLDSWAKHPMNINDEEQKEKFNIESQKLWLLAKEAKPFDFMTVNDVLEENHVLHKRNAELEDMIKNDIAELKKATQKHESSFNLVHSEIEKISDKSKQSDNDFQLKLKQINTKFTNVESKISKDISKVEEGVSDLKEANENHEASSKKSDIKDKELLEMFAKLNSSTTSSTNMISNDFQLKFKQFDRKLTNVESKMSTDISKVEEGVSDFTQQLIELKKDSHSLQKSLSTEIQERRNLNSVFRKDISTTKSGVAQLQTQSAVLDKAVSFINQENIGQKTGLSKLGTSVAGLTKDISTNKNGIAQ
eukprot:GFUD01005601.1.p1 GENE.GFUD01005601.1~~GFUD01005601.1.p1  ORF type:complete len:567 (+),score=149.53 GFUD01005601.1:90-1703(+)